MYVDYVALIIGILMVIMNIVSVKMLGKARYSRNIKQKIRYYFASMSAAAVMIMLVFSLLLVRGVIDVW